MERDEPCHNGSKWGDDRQCGGICQWSEQQRIEFHCGISAKHYEPLTDHRSGWRRSDNYWDELRIESGYEHGEVQWHDSNGDDMERVEHLHIGS